MGRDFWQEKFLQGFEEGEEVGVENLQKGGVGWFVLKELIAGGVKRDVAITARGGGGCIHRFEGRIRGDIGRNSRKTI